VLDGQTHVGATLLTGAAALVATTAAVYDLRWRRIPNWLTGAALLSGVLANIWVAGFAGLLTALAGAALGLALLLPFYALRGVGAADVKLLAAIGALIGPQLLLWVALFSAVIGGVMSLLILGARGRLGPILTDLLVLRTRPASTGLKAPYGLAIAGGVYLTLMFGALG
jgi:prepilin peptidase CpaA